MAETSARKIILTSEAPKPPPFLSQAVAAGNHVYCSGQVGSDAVTGALVTGSIGERTIQVLKNLEAVLKAAGCTFGDVIKMNVYLTSMDNFAAMNEVYTAVLPDPKPARTCVAVHQLPMGTDVEIECIAYKASPRL